MLLKIFKTKLSSHIRDSHENLLTSWRNFYLSFVAKYRPPALIQDLIAYLNSNSDDKADSARKTHSPEHKEHQSFFPRKASLDKHRRRC
ncbi:hypothetical protein CDAR_384481 [Caerostris darwini]|uniref:Maturase K n=1 Tax=Caerostris darwini TaxID=1538125 RepID=A0AAV4TKW4_9ARAC|nr:hypothetical protein CDAR_384481 [Caerostris darwini]